MENKIKNESMFWFMDTMLYCESEDIHHSFDVTWDSLYSCVCVQINKHHDYPCTFIFDVCHEEDLIITHELFMIESNKSFHVPHTLLNMTYDIFVSCVIEGVVIKNREKIGTYVFDRKSA